MLLFSIRSWPSVFHVHTLNCPLLETGTVLSSRRLFQNVPQKLLCSKKLSSPSTHSLISKVTDVVNEEVEQWRDRPLEAVYPVVWLDGIVVKVHQDNQVLNKTIYLALAINMEGYKELLGIWISEHEGASFWAQVLTSAWTASQDFLMR